MKGLFKNKKSVITLGIAAFMTAFIALPFGGAVCASEAEVVSGDYGFVYDQDDLLTDAEEEALQKKLEEVGEKHDIQIAVVTTGSYSQYTIEEYADDMMDYDELGLKTGNDDSAILLAISMDNREFYESTRGQAIQIFTDSNLYKLEDKFTSYLSSGDYAKAFDRFADGCDDICTSYENRNKIPAWKWLICVLLGLACGGVTVGVMSSGMKNVKQNNSAAEYEERNNVRISASHDRFIRKSINRVRINNESNSRGGSSTHHSSSGNTHGGHGGHF